LLHFINVLICYRLTCCILNRAIDRITELNKTIEGYLMNATWCAHVKDGSYQGERLGVIKNG
jgi:hypothetical protein